MKRSIISILTLAILIFAATSCTGESAGDKAAPVTKEALLHHNFELVSVDGKNATWERTPNIAFNETFNVSGRVCNQFTGAGELKDGKLIVNRMASTKMLCADEALNSLEGEFGVMLSEGMDIRLEGDTLTLKKGDRELVYKLRDLVQ